MVIVKQQWPQLKVVTNVSSAKDTVPLTVATSGLQVVGTEE